MPSISVRRLFSDNQHKLELAWAAGNSGADNRIGVEADKPVLALVGHLNFIHPNQIQVVGVAEAEYLRRLETGELNYDFGELFDIPHVFGYRRQRLACFAQIARLLPIPTVSPC